MDPLFLLVDLFCGAGGTTTGFESAKLNGRKIAKTIACVNHDEKAIESHRKNHKGVHHFTEDIRFLDMDRLMKTVSKQQAKYPNALLILWASLECTNFSKAKGGQSRDADSRTLADCLDRYIGAMNPDYIMIENVVEFMSWGPLDEKGKPISKRNGEDWLRWRQRINSLGYRDEWRELNSANFGAYTSRNRLFGCFAKPGHPIVWPECTHAKNPMRMAQGNLFGKTLKKWKPVKHVLELDQEGPSIFIPGRIRSEATFSRILGGLKKYANNPFISTYYGGNLQDKTYDLNRPSRTLTAQRDQMLVQGQFISKYYSGRDHAQNLNAPGPTITTKDHSALVSAKFIMKYHGNGDNCRSTDIPGPTLDTGDRCALVSANWMDMQYTNGTKHSSISSPAGSITTVPKHNVVSAFIITGHFNNGPRSIEDPAPTQVACRKHMSLAQAFIVNPQFSSDGNSIDAPCPTIIAVQGKRPLMLATATFDKYKAPDFIEITDDSFIVSVYETDSPVMIEIKRFMAENLIADIRMRMLFVRELLKIQGFPHQYKLTGNQSDQKKFIGNSVAPIIPKKWAETFAALLTMSKYSNKKVA